MNMNGYTKLFGSIVASTIWTEPHAVRIVWITMLAMANKNGIVEASLPGLADLSRVTMDEVKQAVKALESPDEYSRTPGHEGRRIEACDGGWKILNHGKYRAKMGADEKREYFRLKKQEQRMSNPGPTLSNNVQVGPTMSRMSRHAEAEAEAVPPPTPKPPTPKDTTPTSDAAKTIATIFRRNLTTRWAVKEIGAFKELQKRGILTPENLQIVETFYTAAKNDPEAYLRTTLPAFLNNFDGEIDKAQNWLRRNPKALARASQNGSKSSPEEPSGFREWFRAYYPQANPDHAFAEIPADIKNQFKPCHHSK